MEALNDYKYYTWTQTGLDCLELRANCAQCDLFRRYQLHKANEGPKKCSQAESNAKLLAAGIEPPEKDKTVNLMKIGKERPGRMGDCVS